MVLAAGLMSFFLVDGVFGVVITRSVLFTWLMNVEKIFFYF